LDLLVGARIVAEGVHVSLADGFELVLVANHIHKPTTDSGKIDWSKVARVKILGISRTGIA
jgi:hypothetical protein